MDSTQLSDNSVQVIAAPLLSEWMHLLIWIEGQVSRDLQKRPEEGQNQ